MDKILFLDVDGPIIPSTMYFTHVDPSYNRDYSPQCIAIINRICKESGCKVVMNTTHNTEPRELRTSMIAQDFRKEYFHETPHTRFPFTSPDNPYNVWPNTDDHPRMEAIKYWIKANGEVDWIALDDVEFTDNERLVLVNYDIGLTLKEYNQVGEIWGLPALAMY